MKTRRATQSINEAIIVTLMLALTLFSAAIPYFFAMQSLTGR